MKLILILILTKKNLWYRT